MDPFSRAAERLAVKAATPLIAIIGVVLLITLIIEALLAIPGEIVGWLIASLHKALPPIPATIPQDATNTINSIVWGSAALYFSGRYVKRHWNDSYTPPPPEPEPITHGSATWGNTQTLRIPAGIILGREKLDLLRHTPDRHLITVAPTRSGKGVSAIIPNLLDYPGSAIVIDPKGENYAVTARARRAMGQEVYALDPFKEVDGTATYNPLAGLNVDDPEAFDHATLIADMLVVPEGRVSSDSAFWNEETKAILVGLILQTANGLVSDCDLIHTHELSHLPPQEFRDLLDIMAASTAAGGLVAIAANQFRRKADKEQSGVMSGLHSHTNFLKSAQIRRVLRATRGPDVFAQLKSVPTTVYLILPPDRLEAYRRWLRLMVACALRAMTRDRTVPTHRVLCIIDEFANLGHMKPIETAVSIAAGYGATMWLLTQDIPRLRAEYPLSWDTFLANADILQAFGTNDHHTADYLSRMIGHQTISVTSENTGVGSTTSGMNLLGSSHSRRGTTTSGAGRPLLYADEIRRLPKEKELVFVTGQDPYLLDRVDYRDHPAFTGHFDPNPLHTQRAPVATPVPELHHTV